VAGYFVGDAEIAGSRVLDERLSPHRQPDGRRRVRISAGQIQSRVLAKDAQLELLQRRAWVDAKLVDEGSAPGLEHVEALRLRTAAVEREHQLAAQALAKRVLGDERLELRNELGVPAECEVGVDAILDRRQTYLLQPRNLALCERLALQLGQRLTAPE